MYNAKPWPIIDLTKLGSKTVTQNNNCNPSPQQYTLTQMAREHSWEAKTNKLSSDIGDKDELKKQPSPDLYDGDEFVGVFDLPVYTQTEECGSPEPSKTAKNKEEKEEKGEDAIPENCGECKNCTDPEAIFECKYKYFTKKSKQQTLTQMRNVAVKPKPKKKEGPKEGEVRWNGNDKEEGWKVPMEDFCTLESGVISPNEFPHVYHKGHWCICAGDVYYKVEDLFAD